MFPPPRFFSTETLNIAEMILRRGRDEDIAIYFARETATDVQEVTWGDLKERVRVLRGAMVNSGVKRGDFVAAVISNSVHAISIALATLSIGAVWSSTACDMGVAGIVDRYSQISPKIIFADDGYVYAGKTTSLAERITEWADRLKPHNKKLSNVVIIPSCGVEVNVSDIHRGCTLNHFLSRDTGCRLSFDMVPFSHPAFILYSSGTVSPSGTNPLRRGNSLTQ